MRLAAGLALAAAFALGGLLAGCVRHRPAPAPVPSPHYLLGSAYQAGGHWFYPDESYDFDRTGIACVADAGHGLTADGEAADAGALTAAMQTVQLPAIARVTNLQNGRQILVRVNDRGPADPARLISLSPRAGELLGIAPSGAAPVRVALDAGMSHRVVDQVGGGPKLAVSPAPRGTVQAQDLPAPGGGGGGQLRTIGAEAAEDQGPPVPDRLPERVLQLPMEGGEIFLDAGRFGRFEYANERAASLSGLGADVVRSREGRSSVFAVRAGPFRSIAAADAALAMAMRAGILDARLVIE